MYVFVVITCGTGKRPCCSIATTTIKGASYEPLWDECYWLSLIGPKTPDIYPQDTLTFSVFSSSGHTEDTFLGQASIEVTREMFLGMAFTYTLDLHHAYQPIYLDENTTADHIADLKEEPQGKLREEARLVAKVVFSRFPSPGAHIGPIGAQLGPCGPGLVQKLIKSMKKSET